MVAGIVVGSIVGAIALVLCIPFYGSIEVRAEETFDFRLRLRWLFGAFKRQFPGAKPEPAGGEGGRRVPEKYRPRLVSGVLGDSEDRASLNRLVSALVRSVRVESLEADFRLGLEDPADTALVFGPAGAVSVLINLYTDHSIWLIPDMEGESLQGHLNARFRWRPIRLFRPVMGFLFSGTGRRMAKRALLRR